MKRKNIATAEDLALEREYDELTKGKARLAKRGKKTIWNGDDFNDSGCEFAVTLKKSRKPQYKSRAASYELLDEENDPMCAFTADDDEWQYWQGYDDDKLYR